MGVGLEPIIAPSRADQRATLPSPSATPRPAMVMLLGGAWLLLLGGLCLAGCGGSPETVPPKFIGGNHYAVITTNRTGGNLPQGDIHALYYYPDGPQGARQLIWPALTTEDQAVLDNLVVFNGGLADDVIWKYYPALFAYNGAGSVVELTLPACRQIKGATAGWTNFAFTVMSASNNVILLDASQRSPMDEGLPKRVLVEFNKADILKAMALAQSQAFPEQFNGIKFYTAP